MKIEIYYKAFDFGNFIIYMSRSILSETIEEKKRLMEKQHNLDLEKGRALWSHFLLEHPKSKQKWQSLIYLLHHEPTQDLQTLSKIQDGSLQEGLIEVLGT